MTPDERQAPTRLVCFADVEWVVQWIDRRGAVLREDRLVFRYDERQALEALIAKWRADARAKWKHDFDLSSLHGIRLHYDATDMQHAIDTCADELAEAIGRLHETDKK